MLKTFFKAIIYTALLLLLLLVSAQMFLLFYYSNYIREGIQNEVSAQSRSQYTCEIEKFRMSLFPPSIKFTSVTIRPDLMKTSSAVTYLATFDEIAFKNINIYDYIFHRKLSVANAAIISPSISIYRNSLSPAKDSVRASAFPKSIHPLASKIILNNFTLLNVKINLFSSFTDTIPSFTSEDNKIEFENFVIDEFSGEAGMPFTARKFKINIKKFNYPSESGLYSITAEDFSASYFDSVISFSDVALIPLYSKKQFSKESGSQTDRFNIHAGDITLYHTYVKDFLETGNCRARLCEMNDIKFTAFRDKNSRRDETPADSPQNLIRKIPFYVNIDSIKINSAAIAYEELAEGANKSGEITFNQLNAIATGFTNDSLLSAGNKVLEINASALLMNSGKISAKYVFPLNTTETQFQCSGVLEKFPLPSLNKMLKYNINLLIKDGVADRLEFAFQANEKYSTGELTFLYHDLKIETLNERTNKNNLKEKLLSFSINTFVLKSSNPRKNDAPVKGRIYYQRNPNRFIFYYTWKSVLSGLKPTMGIN